MAIQQVNQVLYTLAPQLTPGEFRCLVYLADRAEPDGGRVFASTLAQLPKWAKLSVSYVRLVLQRFKRRGWLLAAGERVYRLVLKAERPRSWPVEPVEKSERDPTIAPAAIPRSHRRDPTIAEPRATGALTPDPPTVAGGTHFADPPSSPPSCTEVPRARRGDFFVGTIGKPLQWFVADREFLPQLANEGVADPERWLRDWCLEVDRRWQGKPITGPPDRANWWREAFAERHGAPLPAWMPAAWREVLQ